MRPVLPLLTLLVALLPALAGADGRKADLYRMLNGVDGSQARIRLSPDTRGNSNRVTVCVSVPADHGTNKGLGTRSGARAVGVPGGPDGCLAVAPISQTLVLFTQDAGGALTRSIAFSVDLGGYAGHLLFIEWIAEAPN